MPMIVGIMEENQHHLYILLAKPPRQFCGIVDPISEFFWNCLEKWIHLLLTERFPNSGGFHKKCFQNHEIVCSRKVSYNLVFFLKFYSCVSCVKISVTISRDWLCFIWSISKSTVIKFIFNLLVFNNHIFETKRQPREDFYKRSCS